MLRLDSSLGPCALWDGADLPRSMRMQPELERAREGNIVAVVADSAADGILQKQSAPEIETVESREAKIRPPAFAAVS